MNPHFHLKDYPGNLQNSHQGSHLILCPYSTSIHIIWCLPSTTCTSERSFSSLTYLTEELPAIHNEGGPSEWTGSIRGVYRSRKRGGRSFHYTSSHPLSFNAKTNALPTNLTLPTLTFLGCLRSKAVK